MLHPKILMTIEVKNNFLNKKILKVFLDKISNSYFPWYLQNKINDIDKSGYGYFTHSLFLDRQVNSSFYELIMPDIIKSLNIKSLIRARLNLYPRTSESIKHAYHVDYDFKHKAAVYFINSNNGFLFFKNPLKKIKPEANKCVIFDGEHSHSSSSCTDKTNRITLNINYDN